MQQHFQKFIELLICTDVAERDLILKSSKTL